MFEDFHTGIDPEATRRQGSSLAVAVLLYGLVFAGLIITTATASKVADMVEDLPDVTFVPPAAKPPPEPLVPAAAVEENRRKPVRRVPLTPPEKISNEKPQESDRELAEEEAASAEEESSEGAAGGQPGGHVLPLPPKLLSPARPPVRVASTFANRPRYSKEAIRKGVQGVVVVVVEVTETGSVGSVRVVSGARELVEMTLKWAPSWRYQPATRDGKPIRWFKRESIRFQLEDR